MDDSDSRDEKEVFDASSGLGMSHTTGYKSRRYPSEVLAELNYG